jgi:hypothetical protein
MKRGEIAVALLAVGLFVFCLLTQLPGERMRWEGEARVLLSPTPEDWYAHDPYLVERKMLAISNSLSDPASLQMLADVSAVNPSEFKLIDIKPIRGTRIVAVHFGGVDPDVERVASNTFEFLKGVCFTNEPNITITNIEFSSGRRKPPWRRKWDELTWRWLP